jgi:hypothetical protein
LGKLKKETTFKTYVYMERQYWNDLTLGWNGVGWIDLTQDRENWRDLEITVMKIRVTYNAENLLSSSGNSDFCKGTLLLGISYDRPFGGRL